MTGMKSLMPDHKQFKKHSQHGFTLLEVLIALLILSIGLLGLAALQTTGLRSNQMANMRTLATQAAYDITDRMRANELAMGVDRDPDTGIVTYVAGNDSYIITRTAADPVPTVDCTTNECTPAQLATFDLSQWRNRVSQLPGGKSEITGPAGAVFEHTVIVYWDQNRTGATGTNCPPLSDDDLRCIRLVFSE